MRLLLYFALLLVGNSILLYLLDNWGLIVMEQSFQSYFLVTIILSLLNTLLKPVLKLLTIPLYILTFGLFSVVINAAILWLTDYMVGGIEILGVMSLIYATILLSLFHAFLHSLIMQR